MWQVIRNVRLFQNISMLCTVSYCVLSVCVSSRRRRVNTRLPACVRHTPPSEAPIIWVDRRRGKKKKT